MTIINTNSISGINSITAQGSSGVAFYDSSGSSERLRITSGGNIGINNSAPLYAMHFKNAMSSSPSFVHMEVTGSNAVGGGGGIAFDTSASNAVSNNGLYLATISGVRNSADDGSNDLVFKTSKSGVAGDDGNTHSPKERLRITADGKIGIGIDAPEDKLHVKSGKIRIENAIVSNNDSTIAYDNTDFVIDVDPNNVRGSSALKVNIDTVNAITIDDSRRVLAGLTASVDSNSTLQVEGRNTITAIRYSAATGNAGSKLELSRSASNTVGTTAAVSATDELGEIRFRGASTGSAFNTGAVISAVITSGTISASSFPTDLLFKTTNNGAASATEKLRITSGGTIESTAGSSTLAAKFSGNGVQVIHAAGSNIFLGTQTGTDGKIGTTNNANLHLFANGYGNRITVNTSGSLSIVDGDVNVANGHGINFGSTTPDGVGTVFSETLDDYEEGIWVPSNYTGASVSLYRGYYIKIGRQVTVWFSGALSSGTGNAFTATLPFAGQTSGNTGTSQGVEAHGNCMLHGANPPANTYNANIYCWGTVCSVYWNVDSSGWVQAAGNQLNGSVQFTATYVTA